MIVMLVALMLIPATIVLAESQGEEKVEVCHIDGQGNFSLITISNLALESHLAHGDLLPFVDPRAEDIRKSCIL